MTVNAGSDCQITVKMNFDGSTIMNVWSYRVTTMPALITGGMVAEAYWNHVKTTYRALSQVGSGAVFTSVLFRELSNPNGELGEYAIPSAEQVGTRANQTNPDSYPAFVAAGARLTVTTRTTRPGQKRFPFLTESDVSARNLGASFITLVDNLLDVANAAVILGAPAATGTLTPYVFRLDNTGTVVAGQATLGHVINPYVTSQVSRKYGRGM